MLHSGNFLLGHVSNPPIAVASTAHKWVDYRNGLLKPVDRVPARAFVDSVTGVAGNLGLDIEMWMDDNNVYQGRPQGYETLRYQLFMRDEESVIAFQNDLRSRVAEGRGFPFVGCLNFGERIKYDFDFTDFGWREFTAFPRITFPYGIFHKPSTIKATFPIDSVDELARVGSKEFANGQSY